MPEGNTQYEHAVQVSGEHESAASAANICDYLIKRIQQEGWEVVDVFFAQSKTTSTGYLADSFDFVVHFRRPLEAVEAS